MEKTNNIPEIKTYKTVKIPEIKLQKIESPQKIESRQKIVSSQINSQLIETNVTDLQYIEISQMYPSDQTISQGLQEFITALKKSKNTSINNNLPISKKSKAIINSIKNRYHNVLPYDNNIPQLTNDKYINASYINISNTKFIATQAPLINTFNDFWQMVYENKTSLIVMLTKLLENNKIKAHCYWPNTLDKKETFGDIYVVLNSISGDNILTSRQFTVGKKNECDLVVTHLQFTGWDDKSIPEVDYSYIYEKLIEPIIKNVDNDTNIPIIHCSAGIGRTGTLLAMISYILNKRNNKILDIDEIIFDLRKQREGMVQTDDQKKYILDFIDWLRATLLLSV